MKILPIISLFLFLLAPFGISQLFDWNAEALPGVKIDTVAFRGWIPEATGVIRGTLVLIPGRHGDGRGMATDPRWQALATEMGFAVIGCQFTNGEPFPYQSDPQGEVARSINTAVEHLSAESKHPEIASAPLAFWGTSAGSNVSACYCREFPLRVAAFASSKGTFGPGDNTSSESRDIPMFFVLGAEDKAEWIGPSMASIEKGTKLRAPWTLAFHKKEGHGVGNSLDAAIPFIRSAVEQRLNPPVSNPSTSTKTPLAGFKTKLPGFSKPAAAPTQTVAKVKLFKINQQNGWLGNPVTYEVALAKDYKGSRSNAIWLPDELAALAWQKYLQSGL